MDFFFKKQLVFLFDSFVSLKQAYPASLLFPKFPKGVALLSSVLKKEKKSVTYKKAIRSEVILRSPPKTIEREIHQKFLNILKYEVRERFVLGMKETRVAFEDCFVITSKGFLIEELNPLMGRNTSRIFYHNKMPNLKHVRGKVAVLFNNNNYFHWMTEVLPRILLLKKVNSKPDYFLVGADNLFKKESLEKLGIPKSKIIVASNDLHVSADEFVVPSFPSNSGNPTKMVSDFLRKTFLVKAGKDYKKKYERIYVKRGKVNSRSVTNEKEVMDFLSKFGFTAISLDGLSIKEQAKIFSSAKVIVAYHGGALTNLVFCQKRTKVIEFFHPDYVNVCYWSLSNLVGIDYSYFTASPIAFSDLHLNVLVDIKKLGNALDLAGIVTSS